MTYVNEEFRSRVLLAPQTTAAGAGGYVALTPGSSAITVRAIVAMGNAADVLLTLNSADDTSGTNATAMAVVPIFDGGVRQVDGYSYTVSSATGNFIIDFEVMPELIPAGKTIGLAFATSNALNLISASIFEDVVYVPSIS